MFEKAVRLKLRYEYLGLISVEDLWDLSVESLDDIFKGLNAQVKRAQEESLLDVRSQEDKILDLKIGIVKHVVAVKLLEKSEREGEAERKARKQKLMAVLAEKQDAELHDLSPDELQEMIEALG